MTCSTCYDYEALRATCDDYAAILRLLALKAGGRIVINDDERDIDGEESRVLVVSRYPWDRHFVIEARRREDVE